MSNAIFMPQVPAGLRVVKRYVPRAEPVVSRPLPPPPPAPGPASEPARIFIRTARETADAPRRDLDALPVVIEQELIAILEAPAPAHLTSSHAFKLREEALLFVMSALTIAQSKRLHTRLVAQMSDDALAAAFQLRLVGDRRNRILQFLAQAPRRQALRNAR